VIAGIWDGRGWRDPLGYDTRKLGIGGTDTSSKDPVQRVDFAQISFIVIWN
jgi:hypothetical protein